MPYTYSEHISDIGISVESPTLKCAFEEGALAMLNIMFDLDTIREKTEVLISAEARDMDMLFVEVLNEVLSIQGRDDLALKRLKAHEVKDAGGALVFIGSAFGEGFDKLRHSVKTEVKGATYSGLEYKVTEKGGHSFKCVLDV
jgi:SHS2 domain-containing protein